MGLPVMMIKKVIPKELPSTRGSRRRGYGLSDYQRQMLKRRREELGISQAELARMVSQFEGLDEPIAQSNISNLERIDTGSQTRLPNQGSRYLPAIEQILKLPTDFLRPGRLHPPKLTPVASPPRVEEPPQPIYRPTPPTTEALATPAPAPLGTHDLPVYYATYGQHGAVIMNTEAAEHISRPAGLLRVSSGYGMRVVPGLGMEPKYEPGEVIFVNPRIPGLPNKMVVLRKQQDGGEMLLRRLINETVDEWTVQQLNPPRTYSLPKAEWPLCYRVVGTRDE